jgi:hypothetical protein
MFIASPVTAQVYDTTVSEEVVEDYEKMEDEEESDDYFE